MKIWEKTLGYSRDPETGEGIAVDYVSCFEQSWWRVVLGPLMHWLSNHTPDWATPGKGGPSYRFNDDRTCTFLWRLNLELWLCHEFHFKGRKEIHFLKVGEERRGPPRETK